MIKYHTKESLCYTVSHYKVINEDNYQENEL